MFRSLRFRFVLYFLGFMSASLALLAKSLFDHEHESLLGELRKRLAVEATNLQIQAREALETGDELGILQTLRARISNHDLEYAVVVQHDATVFAHSDVHQLGRRFPLPEAARGLEHGLFYDDVQLQRRRCLRVWAPVVSDLSGVPERIGLVSLAVSEEPLQLAINEARRKATQMGALFIMLGIVGTALITSTVIRPIGQLVHGVQRVAAGDLNHKLRLNRGDEIGLLAHSFDQMTDDLSAAQQKLLQKSLYDKELEFAGKIQKALLPEGPPVLDEYAIAALAVPARVVGGDFYDFLQLSDGRTAFLVADVAGKGVSAGLVMTAVRSAARSIFRYTTSPHEALLALNEQVRADFDQTTFVTILLMVLDPQARRLSVANAGHPPVLWHHAARGQMEFVRLRGAAVGILPGEQFGAILEERTLVLEAGDLIIGVTDGVHEAHDPADTLFGEARFERFARDNAHQSPRAFLDGLYAELQRFSRGVGQFDDITAVALKLDACERITECVASGDAQGGGIA